MATDTQLAANNLFSSGALPLSRLSTPTMPIFFALCHFFQLLVSSVAILVHSGLPWSSTCFLSIFPSVTFLSGESCLRIYPISMWWYVCKVVISVCSYCTCHRTSWLDMCSVHLTAVSSHDLLCASCWHERPSQHVKMFPVTSLWFVREKVQTSPLVCYGKSATIRIVLWCCNVIWPLQVLAMFAVW